MTTKINTEYEPDSHLPASALRELAIGTDFWQRRFRRGHDKDGTHNDPLIPHAWAICTLTGAGVVVLKSEGFAAPSRIGVGLVEFTTTKSLVAVAWQLLGWPVHRADTGAPYYAYEVPTAKTSTVSWLQLCTKAGVASDINFAVGAYGLRP
jgi:hypothetical protein